MENRRIFWGWFVVIGAFFVLALNYGTRYAFGVFLPALSAEHGWSHLYLSLAAALNMFFYACGNIVTGHLADTVAPRWVITIGAVLLALCFFLLPLITSPVIFCVVYGVVGGLGASAMGVVICGASVGKWFIKKRGLAMGLAMMGIGVGTAIIVPAAGFLEAVLGWQFSFFFLGLLILLFAVIPAQLALRVAYPEDISLSPDGKTGLTAEHPRRSIAVGRLSATSFVIIRQRGFVLMAISFGLAVMVVMTVFVHAISSGIASNIDKKIASLAIGLLSLAGLSGQVFFGSLSDKLRHPRNAALLGLLLMALGLLVLCFASSVAAFSTFAVIFGFGYGSLAPMAPLLIARIFGREKMGSIHGVLTLFLGIGGALGPLIASTILEIGASYQAVWSVFFFILLLSAYLMSRLQDENPLTEGEGQR